MRCSIIHLPPRPPLRLQADFYVTGRADPVEGWSLVSGRTIGIGNILQLWEPANMPAVSIGNVGALGGKTSRYWVLSDEGTVRLHAPLLAPSRL